MKFGRFSVDEANGVLLAHTLRTGDCLLKKGRCLTAEDIAALRSAGVASVEGARLEADDVHEDRAAWLVATALAGQDVEVRAPHNGRCHLHATKAGVITIGRQPVEDLNLCSEEIAVATLLPYSVVRAGEVVATIKTIPFAVSRSTVDLCCIAAGDMPPIALAPFLPHRVALIITTSAATPDALLASTAAVTSRRLEALGSRLAFTQHCRHDVEAVTAALLAVRAAGFDLLLVSGATVSKDRRDVIPTAIAAAGGQVEHFGMPVEPGNMLLLARLGELPLVNLPGCARSIRENGLDWILARLLAKLPVTTPDIRLMGVGGLIRSRAVLARESDEEPASRQATRPDLQVAALILAAGRSTRMGRQNKLLVPVDGMPMVVRVADAACASRAGHVLLVTGHDAASVEASVAARRLSLVHNPLYARGMATSLAAGISALPGKISAVIILLGDMPYVSAADIDRLVDAHAAEPDAICVPYQGGRRGNPVLWPRRDFAALIALSGDAGGRALLDEHAERVRPVPFDSDAIHRDIDTPEALACATAP